MPQSPLTLRSWTRLGVCIALCAAAGALGSVATTPEIPTWYAGLDKPAWTPPNLAFPIAWTLLYLMMAVAWWRLWDRAPASRARNRAIALFLIQLALNATWSPLFFGHHAINGGLAVIVLLVLALAALLPAAFRADRVSGWLLAPYLAWVCYAASLNAAIAALN